MHFMICSSNIKWKNEFVFNYPKEDSVSETQRRGRGKEKGLDIHSPLQTDWFLERRFDGQLFSVFCRGRKTKQLVYMQSFWSHFKGITHQGQRHLLEEEQSIPMKN